MASASSDIIASKITTIFRHLLLIEADAADGSSYKTSSSATSEEELECSGRLSDGDSVLHIHIPCLGTINIERHGGVSKSIQAPSDNPGPLLSTSPLPERQVEYTRQLSNIPDYLTTYSFGDQLGHMDWQYSAMAVPQNSASARNIQNVSNFRDYDTQISQPLISGLEVSAEDWALQGVDTALFDSIIRGSELDVAEMSHQTP
jgi:hypothetical protein